MSSNRLQYAGVHYFVIGLKRHLMRRSDLVAIGKRSGHRANAANRSLLTHRTYRKPQLMQCKWIMRSRRMRQRLHDAGTFSTLRPVILEMLRTATKETGARALPGRADMRSPRKPTRSEWLLTRTCCRPYDPLEETSFDGVEWSHNEHMDIEVSFTKKSDGILRIFRAIDDSGRPFHRGETLYSLDVGWKSRELSNRSF